MKLEPNSYYPAVLFGPRSSGQLVKLDGEEHIKTGSGLYYPVNLVAQKAHLFEGVDLCTHHGSWGEKPWDRPLRVGRVLNVVWDPKQREVRGVLEIQNPAIQRCLEGLKDNELPGLSPIFRNYRYRVGLVLDILNIDSVDFCDEPSSGARVLPLTEDLRARNLQERISCIEYNNGVDLSDLHTLVGNHIERATEAKIQDLLPRMCWERIAITTTMKPVRTFF